MVGDVGTGSCTRRRQPPPPPLLTHNTQEVLGDQWQIFLLEDKEEKPTAVLLPASAREGVLSPVTEVWLAVVFGLASVAASLQAAGLPVFSFLTNPFFTAVTAQVCVDVWMWMFVCVCVGGWWGSGA